MRRVQPLGALSRLDAVIQVTAMRQCAGEMSAAGGGSRSPVLAVALPDVLD
jgi:hypothetical protein